MIMKRFEELMPLAEKADCCDIVHTIMERAQSINQETKTGVIITGGVNSGKTTIINGITGTKFREPSLLSEEEKPLRVVFEKTDDIEGFECKVAANRAWNEENVVLYEMKIQDIMREGQIYGQYLDYADIVFYVISAVAPFTSEDMEVIQALSFMQIKVVLNKINLVDESSRRKIEEYVIRVCKNLNVGAPIIIQNPDWEGTAKEFRSALPILSDRQLIKNRYQHILFQQAVKTVRAEAEKLLTLNEMQMDRKKADYINNNLEVKEQQALWRKIRIQMLESGEELAGQIEQDTKQQINIWEEEFFKKGKEVNFNENWMKKHLPSLIQKEMKELVHHLKNNIEDWMKKDCQNMMQHAVNLGLTSGFDISDLEFTALTSIISTGNKLEIDENNKSGDFKILLGTGAAIGLFITLPFPTTLSMAGSVAAAGIGGAVYLKDKKTAQEQEWMKAIRGYCKENLYNLSNTLTDSIRDYYKRLADRIEKKASSVTEQPLDETKYKLREEELNMVIRHCQGLTDL